VKVDSTMKTTVENESTRYSVIVHRVRMWRDKERVYKESEVPMSPAQERLWFELSNLTTDEPTRLAMLTAALRVKDEMLVQVLERVDIDPETRDMIREKLLQRRQQLARDLSGSEDEIRQ
jgi:hypothetical protein